MVSVNKRQYLRVRYHREVAVEASAPVLGASISEGGMFIYTMAPFQSGHDVMMNFPLLESPLAISGTIRHYQSGIGMGLMFLNPTENQVLSLRRFVDAALAAQQTGREAAILLVDGNETKRRLYRAALTQSHYQVVEASSVSQAFTVLHAGGVGVLVFDPHIPNGFALVKRLRANSLWKQIVPIVLSSRPIAEEIRRQQFPMVKHLFQQAAVPPMRLPQIIAKYLP